MDKLMKLIVAVQLRMMGAAEEKEKGATATEYALLIAMIATVIIVGIAIFGNALSGFFSTLGSTVTGWTSAI